MSRKEKFPISKSQRTFMPSGLNIERRWEFIDVSGKVLGRIATEVSKILRGKNSPSFIANIDTGHHVVLLNSDKIVLTGRKMDKKEGKKYYSHSGYPSGLKERNAAWFFDNGRSSQVIYKAVEGQMPRNKLSQKQLSRLIIYRDANFKQIAQFNRSLKIKKEGFEN